MKTNASPKTIVKAVENVSARLYNNNVIFRKYPEKLTKNVNRFTLRTIDAHKAGSMETKAGLKQPKANWEVHQDVMNEIFKLDPRPNIYVDTLYGRQHNTTPIHSAEMIIESNDEGSASSKPRVKRKYTKRIAAVAEPEITSPFEIKQFIKALKFVVKNPHLLAV